MLIVTQKTDEGLLYTLPCGDQIEITTVVAQGNKTSVEPDEATADEVLSELMLESLHPPSS